VTDALPREIDLNADLGESFGVWRLGDDEAMLEVVTSANGRAVSTPVTPPQVAVSRPKPLHRKNVCRYF